MQAWVEAYTTESISWEEDHDLDRFSYDRSIDTRKVIQTKRRSSGEISIIVLELCMAIGIHAEMVRRYPKTQGEDLDLDAISRPNHFWDVILVDGEWRMMDASLASATNPRRILYSSVSTSIAEAWYFLSKPSEIC